MTETAASDLGAPNPDLVHWGPLRFSYAWILVVALFGMALLIQGIALGTITLFDEKLLAELGVNRGTLKVRDSIFLLSTAVSCLMLGRVCEALGIRRTMILGLATMSACLLAYSFVPPLAVIYFLHAMLGFSLSTAHVVMIMIVLSRWFDAEDPRRGIALGITVSGASFGAVAMSQLVAWWLSFLPWIEVFRLMAVLPLAMVPVVLALVRPPLGDGGGWRLPGRGSGADLRHALVAVGRSPQAALLLLGIVPVFYVSAAVFAHTVLLLRDLGLSLQQAAGGVGTIFLFGLIGKLSSGFGLLRLSLRTCWLAYLSMMLAGSLLLWLAPLQAHTPAIALIGLGWGGCFPLTQLRIASVFPGPNLPRVLGLFIIIESIGSATGAWLTGALFDLNGSYRWALAVIAALTFFACLVALPRVEKISSDDSGHGGAR